jgi:predicted ATPase
LKQTKNSPRFLPTLTQIVTLPSTQASATTDVDQILERLMPVVEDRMRQALETVIQSNMQILRQSFRTEIDAALREPRAGDYQGGQGTDVV